MPPDSNPAVASAEELRRWARLHREAAEALEAMARGDRGAVVRLETLARRQANVRLAESSQGAVRA